MPLLLLLTLVLTVAAVVGLVTWRIRGSRRRPRLDDRHSARGGRRRSGDIRGFAPSCPRLNPETATGLALTVAMIAAIAGGVVFGVLAYLIRTNAGLLGIDNGVAKWGNRHATATSTHVLNDLTQLGGIYVVVGLCVVLAVAETFRQRTVWVPLFIIAVMGGEEILTLSVKQLADRVRPTFNPVAATLGPSFPSGHSATAAAFYATAALLIGRWRPRPTRAVIAGLAAGIAVGVAATRVLLDVHWLTDVIAGLSLGWAWFAVCAMPSADEFCVLALQSRSRREPHRQDPRRRADRIASTRAPDGAS
jgi:Membrane-associated phospholipid phosphatase